MVRSPPSGWSPCEVRSKRWICRTIDLVACFLHRNGVRYSVAIAISILVCPHILNSHFSFVFFFTFFFSQLLGPTTRHLKLSGNAFVGAIPKEIKCFKAGNLEVLHLDSNNFNGMLPPEFFTLKKLRRLWIESNYFTGSINFFYKFKLLHTLIMGNNLFGEEVPDSLAKLKSLKVLRMNDCRFVGVFPIEVLLKMKQLRELDVQGCKYMNQNSLKRVLEWSKEKKIKVAR